MRILTGGRTTDSMEWVCACKAKLLIRDADIFLATPDGYAHPVDVPCYLCPVCEGVHAAPWVTDFTPPKLAAWLRQQDCSSLMAWAQKIKRGGSFGPVRE